MQTLTVNGRYENIQPLNAFLMKGAETAGLEMTAVFQIELACDEACTNIIEHAYGGEDKGDITARWFVDGDFFTIVLHDNGRSFDPSTIPPPTTLTEPTIENFKIGGLGIHFMQELMDEISYDFDDDGNELTMRKRITSPVLGSKWVELAVNGRFDHNQTPQIEAQLTEMLQTIPPWILVDLSQTSYINSGGLRCLVTAWRKARKQGGDVQLKGLNGRLQEIFEMVGFDNVFTII